MSRQWSRNKSKAGGRRRLSSLTTIIASLRWRIAFVLSVAIGISYLDRQALSVAVAAIQQEIPLTNTDFSRLQIAFLAAYGVMYAGGGALIDKLGTRVGFI